MKEFFKDLAKEFGLLYLIFWYSTIAGAGFSLGFAGLLVVLKYFGGDL